VFGQEQPLLPVTIADLQSDFYPADSLPLPLFYIPVASIPLPMRGIFLKCAGSRLIKFGSRYTLKKGLSMLRNIKYGINNDAAETVFIDKAVTYNLINGNVVTTNLGPDGVFDEPDTKGVMNKRVLMPSAKEKSIIELHYTIISPLFYKIPEWDFQQKIPVKYSELVTIVPATLTFNAIFRGFYKIDQKNFIIRK
jgi:hypothetical protein